jgi:hypothetical protein
MNATTTTTNHKEHESSDWYNVDYKSAAEWNLLYGTEDIRTEREQRKILPEHIDLVCHQNVRDNTYHLRQKRLSANEIWTIAMDGEPCVVQGTTQIRRW